jgi:phosphonopyruvate decarboxylase
MDRTPLIRRLQECLPDGAVVITGESLLNALEDRGIGPYTGTPCSYLQPLISYTIQRRKSDFIMAANEGEAIAIAAGAWLAGKRPVVMFQNSGLGNAVNPLASLCWPFRIPVLILCTWRGQPGRKDEPQHELMGRITPSIFDSLEIGHRVFPSSPEELNAALDEALDAMGETGLSRAFILPKGCIETFDVEFKEPLLAAPSPGQLSGGGDVPEIRIGRLEALQHIRSELPDSFLIATTGKAGRELYELGDREDQFYMVGSMGCAPSLALGAALGKPEKRFTVIDGDGALLMRLESLVTVGQYHPANLTHILLDNEKHDSTGGQPTLSPGVDFCALAIAAGYASAAYPGNEEAFVAMIRQARDSSGPHFIHFKIGAGAKEGLGRPGIQPHEVAQRFKDALVRP